MTNTFILISWNYLIISKPFIDNTKVRAPLTRLCHHNSERLLWNHLQWTIVRPSEYKETILKFNQFYINCVLATQQSVLQWKFLLFSFFVFFFVSVCNQFSRGVFTMLGAVSPESFDTLHSYSNTFQMPFVTPWFPEEVSIVIY